MLPVERKSNNPEAVHSHLKVQSQWSHQAHLFLKLMLKSTLNAKNKVVAIFKHLHSVSADQVWSS